MKDKNNSIISVSTTFQVPKEYIYFGISSKDSFHKLADFKQAKRAFFGCRNAFPVLKSCRILRRPSDIDGKDIIDNDKDFDFDNEQKIDPINKMTTITSNPTPNDGTLKPGSTNPPVVSNLPSTLLQENNNESTLSATADDDDDVTVQTSNSNPTKQGWITYNIKLLLTNKHDTSDSALQHATLTILETIDREMGADVKIVDGVKQQVTDFQVQSATAFQSKFPVSRSRAHQKYNRSATAWALFTVQTRQTLKDIRTHPTITQVLSSSRHCHLIHHQRPLDVTDTTSVGFFVGATPTYTLSSTFKQDLCTLIAKKASIHRKKIPQFQVALTVVRATMMNPETQKDSREACTAFELQVPVSQRRAMEA
jgi:hypothetical protein